MSLTNCRFYENRYPDIDEFVMVNVRWLSLCHSHPTESPANLPHRSNK